MKKVFAAGVMAALALSATAVKPLWLRDVKISPDGKEIAFSYKGDIYKVGAEGGNAVRLTSQPSYESNPVWSPDGEKIAFASARNGGFDVYVMSSDGGVATRLTDHSAYETPNAFTPDGKYVMFTASIQDPATSALFPSGAMSELYKVPVGGGRVTQVMGTPVINLSFLGDGKSFVYEDKKGQEDDLRKHHTSSVTRDVWMYNAGTGRHTNLTLRGGEDRNPVMSADGKTVYFLSERNGGSFNVYSFPLDNPRDVKAVTDFKTHPVRFLSIANDGLMAFAYDGEIYTMKPGAAPAKVDIDVVTDYEEPLKTIRVGSSRDVAISPSGKQLAFIGRGEVFVTSADYSSTRQITNTTEAESDVTWGRNDREIFYTSERDGYYNIYVAKIARGDDPNFSNATLVAEKRVFPDDGVDRTMPQLSPDGKTLAFIQDRNKLMVLDRKTEKVRQLTDGSTNARRTKGFGYQWSPDSKWIVIEYTEPHHDPYGDVAVVNVADGKLTKITETGYFDQSPRWVMDGKALLFLSERYGMRNHASWGSQYDVMLTFLDRDAFDRYRLNEEDYALLKEVEKSRKKSEAKKDDDKKKDKKDKKNKKKEEKAESEAAAKDEFVPDFSDLENRTVRLTPFSADVADAILTKDGETLYYLAAFEGGYDLWKMNLRKGSVKIANKLDAGGASMTMDDDGNIYMLGSSIKKLDPKNDKVKNISISTTVEIDPAKEREYMLRYVYNEEEERFLVTDMFGVDWDGLYKAYAKFLPHINNNNDFADLLSELLGELNVSHTGGSYRGNAAKKATAQLGLLYDMSYTGEGLKVDDVVKGGPMDRADCKLRPGAIITAINGKKLGEDMNPMSELNGLQRKKTLVSYRNADGSIGEEVVLPISTGAMNELLYNRWVAMNEKKVEELSGGRLGYVHLRSMNDDSFRKAYAKLLGKYVDKEGIVIDTRFNGGGRLHEDIEVLFSGKTYLTQEVHGTETSVMPSRRWNKPSVMIIGEANYSNAHGTPWVYKHLGLGRLVGMPVPGTMSSVNWVTLQDPTLVFGIPVVAFRTSEGTYLENSQLEPDVKVALDPATVVKGEDTQLKAAVDDLLNTLGKK